MSTKEKENYRELLFTLIKENVVANKKLEVVKLIHKHRNEKALEELPTLKECKEVADNLFMVTNLIDENINNAINQILKTKEKELSKEEKEAIENTFLIRCKNVHNIKSYTKKFYELQVEYFCGAMAILQQLGYKNPIGWEISLMSGREIVKLKN
jgi:hypothetical protein